MTRRIACITVSLALSLTAGSEAGPDARGSSDREAQLAKIAEQARGGRLGEDDAWKQMRDVFPGGDREPADLTGTTGSGLGSRPEVGGESPRGDGPEVGKDPRKDGRRVGRRHDGPGRDHRSNRHPGRKILVAIGRHGERPVLSPEVKAALKAVGADIKAIASGGYITREDLQGVRTMIHDAAADGFTDEEKESIKSALQAIVTENVPEELLSQLAADVDTLMAFKPTVSPEVKAAMQAVGEDLKEIAAGDYVTREDLEGLGTMIREAAAGGFTDEEKASIKSALQAIVTENVPEELLSQLAADVDALMALRAGA